MAATQSIADPTNPTKHGSEVQIDQVNQWMRQQPWYQTYMRSWGQDPGHPSLTKQQSKTILDAARAQGVDVTGDTEVDNHGNFNPKGHKLRNTLIVAGIAAATIATMGAAGAFAGAGAAGGAGAGASGTTAAGLAGAAIPSVTPASLAAAGAGTFAGVPAIAGVTTGATAGAVAPAVAAATKSPSLWRSIAGQAVSAGVPAAAAIIGTKMQVDAARSAAEVEAQAARDALDWQKQVYATRQQQLAPSIGVGNAATLRLGDLMGLKPPAGGYRAQVPTDPGATPAAPATAAAPATPTTGQPVLMRAPNGRDLSLVPADQVEYYTSRGAVPVNTPTPPAPPTVGARR